MEKRKLFLMCALMAGTAFGLAAMPTEAELEREEPAVKRLLASEHAALASGKMTRTEVAAAAMDLAEKADTEAAKLLLMKGAFVLYVRDGNLEKAVETMNKLESAIADMPPEYVENMVELSLLGVSKKDDAARLRRLLADAKVLMPQEKVNGYTWSYQEKNGDATICAVSPKPTGNVSIPATLNGLPVTGIGDKVFEGCRAMNSVAIPSTVKTIGDKAFADCGTLTSLSIPRCVTSIGSWAFANCGGFKSVSLPDGLTEIKRGAFYGTEITSVSIPPNVTSIEPAFVRCYGLKMVMIPASVTNIAECAFGVCTSLESINVDSGNPCYRSLNGMVCSKDGLNLVAGVNGEVTIPEGVTNIGPGAFGSLGGLKLLTIPASVTNISEHAFQYVHYGCGNLTSVTMLGERPNAPDNVFRGCGKLKAIHVPANAKSWAGMKEWQGIPLVFDAKAEGVVDSKAILEAVATYDGDKPTEKGRKVLAKLFPGWSLDTEIDDILGGFRVSHRGQNNVIFLHPMSTEKPTILSRTVTLSDKNPCLFLRVASFDQISDFLLAVRVNGKDALSNRRINTPDCAPWEDLVVPLSDWRGKEVKIEIVLTANNWWCEHPFLSRIEIAEGDGDMRIVEGKVTVDGYTWSYRAQNGEAAISANNACAVCPNPKGDLMIPSTLDGFRVTSIETCAFSGCNELKSVTIPSGVKRIMWCAFYGCKALASVVIPEGVKSIEHGAFAQCGALSSVAIPESVTYIGQDVFLGCGGLTSVTISSNVRIISKGAFLGCKGLESVTIPPSVTTIGMYAFKECGQLKSVTIPENVTSIENDAFADCRSLKSVTIPSSVTKIGTSPFAGCVALTSICVDPDNVSYCSRNGLLCTKDGKSLVSGVNGEVQIPSGVKNIDRGAFCAFGSLRSVTIPEGVTNIGFCAFCRTGIKSLKIPSSVKSLEQGAFWGCDGLTSVTIPDNVTNLGIDVFWRCGNLTSVTMLGERPNAPDNVFRECSKLKAIHVPANAKSWEGMKEWQGIPLVFDAKADGVAATKDRTTVQSIIDGMIKVPGRDLWLSETELTQGQWEAVMGYNLSEHKGANFPVECVCRDDCDVFLEKLNQTKEACASQFEFVLPSAGDWRYAAAAGGAGDDCWIRPGVAGNILDMAWVKENGSNLTHGVATKAPNVFGFYDMLGNVWEWMSERDDKARGLRHGASCCENAADVQFRLHHGWLTPRSRRYGNCGLRVAAHIRTDKVQNAARPRLGGLLARRQEEKNVEQQQATVNGYTWSYRVNNGEAEIISEKDGKRSCAVVPNPTGRLEIPAMIEGVKVTSIGRDAFSGCRGLTAVAIPESVTSIGRGAFFNCGLRSVVIPSSVTQMSLDVFMGCGELSSVTIPPGVSCLEESTFNLCHSLTSVAIPAGVKRIGPCAFQQCGFRSITIPAIVTSVGRWAFRGCRELASVTMLGERPEAPGNVFDDCGKLKAIHVPANAKSWAGMKEWQGIPLVFDAKIDTSDFDNEADPQKAARKAVAALFPGWSLDTEIAPNPRGGFRDSHRGEDNVMFVHPKSEGASAIVSRTMKLSDKNPCLFLKVASWAESVLGYECDFVLAVRVNGRDVLPRRIICTPDYEPWKDIVIPLANWRGHNVKVEIVLTANGWWHEFPLFKRLEIAEGTGREKFVAEAKATVGDYTWSYRVDNGEAEIVSEKDGRFSCAVSPSPKGFVAIPSALGGVKVTRVGRNALRGCKELTMATIPEGVTIIGRDSFADCGILTAVTLPSTLEHLDWGAFGNCGCLASVPLPPSVKSIGQWAFVNGKSLTSVKIPSGVKILRQGVFSGCRGLASVAIPTGVESIESGAFSWYCGFKSVEISSSVTNIEQGAFIDCKELMSFHVDSANPAYSSRNGLLCSKDGTFLVAGVNGDVTIPEGVTCIGKDAFHGCFGLKAVAIPSSVANIGEGAFSFLDKLASVRVDDGNRFYKSVNGLLLTKDGTELVRGGNGDVTIPAGVTNIGVVAFSCCKLTSVAIPESMVSIGHAAFVGCGGLKVVSIPSGVKEMSALAFENCGDLESVTMLGERPKAPDNVFRGCGKLKAIHVPANAKSWEGMKEWQGIPLVFDAKTEGAAPDRQAQIAEERKQREAEREELRRQLLAIQEELRRARKEKAASSSVVEQSESATERTRKAIAKMFPGWSLDTEVVQNVEGFHVSHRGQNNVVCVHPKDMGTPAIVSRTVTLSDKNPCLFLKVASWKEDADFILSVRVNGKDALPKRIICTPDCEPWQDIVVPLADWRGSEVKIEVVFTANGWHAWWPENPMLARLEIAESNGDMRIVEGKETIDGYTWSYRAQNGEATIIAEKEGDFSCAVTPGPVGSLAIPAMINGAKVTRIGRDALVRCGNLKSVVIPNGVKRIDRGAFYECGMLKSVKIPSSVTCIGMDAFKNCTGLAEVSIPSSVDNIELGTFDNCSGLTSVAIPDGVKSIGAYAFRNCKRLASVKIPEGVTRVGRDVFAGCDSLEQVTIPSSLSHIEWGMFGNCVSLEAVTIQPGVRSIGPWAFVNCNSLTEVTIPPGVCSIDNGAFRYCNLIKTVSIPASVTNIHGAAFCESGTLMSFRVAEDNPVYKSENGMLLTKDGSTLVHGVNGDVTIPPTVTNIQWSAFEGFRALERVVIPAGVKVIGDYAFKNCYGLTSVTALGERPNVGSHVFDGCGKLKEIHVPENAKSWAGMKEWQGVPLVFDANR